MKKISVTPVNLVLSIFSWLIAIFGLLGGFLIIFTSYNTGSLIKGFLVLLGSLVLAAVVRVIGNIGQMLFDLRLSHARLEQSLKLQILHLKDINLQFKKLTQDLSSDLEIIHTEFQGLRNDFAQLNCDSKGINQNIHNIKNFFEQIERQLNLKK